jgi:ABC-type cobalamin/Fe3+-siderophores transport system ATPase subunit
MIVITPTVSIQSALFSDETKVTFTNDDIVVFVGPNNAGKSAALRNIKEKSHHKAAV